MSIKYKFISERTSHCYHTQSKTVGLGLIQNTAMCLFSVLQCCRQGEIQGKFGFFWTYIGYVHFKVFEVATN